MVFRHVVGAVGLVWLLQLTGCMQLSMSPPQPTIATTSKLRAASFTMMKVGAFALDAAKDPQTDKGISIRTNTLSSPVNGAFSQHLRELLRVELQAAGLLDDASPVVITGTLLEHDVQAPIGKGSAVLSARFIVTLAGVERYKRDLRVESGWDSPFLGAVAIPGAVGQYENLYHKLVDKLLDDPDFRKAVAKGV